MLGIGFECLCVVFFVDFEKGVILICFDMFRIWIVLFSFYINWGFWMTSGLWTKMPQGRSGPGSIFTNALTNNNCTSHQTESSRSQTT